MWLTPRSDESKKSVQKILPPTGLVEPKPDAEPEVKASNQSTGSNPARVPCQASGGDGGISRESGEKTEDSESREPDEEEVVERKS